MNTIDDREKFGRDEPNFQDEYLDDDRNAALDDGVIDAENQDLNRQFNSIDNERNDEEDFGTIDEESRDDEEDFDEFEDDDLEEDGDLDDDDLDDDDLDEDDFDDEDEDDLEENNRKGDLYKDVDLSLQDEINQDQEEIDPVNHQRNY